MTTGKRTKTAYLSLLDSYLTPAFHEWLFTERKDGRFYRQRSRCLCSIGIRFIPDRDADEGSVVVGIGVGFSGLNDILVPLGFMNVDARDIEYPHIIGSNIGHLMPENRYREWVLLPDSDLVTISTDIVHSIERYGNAFFGRFGSLDRFISEVGGADDNTVHDHCYIAAAYCLRREGALAVKYLEELREFSNARFHRTGSRHYADDAVAYEQAIDVVKQYVERARLNR